MRFSCGRSKRKNKCKCDIFQTCFENEQKRSFFFDWRRKRDSNPRCDFSHTAFPGLHLKPLGHLCIFRFKKFVIKFCLRPLNIYMSGLRSMRSPKTLAIFGVKRKTSYKAKFSNLFGNKPPSAVFLAHSDISA